MVTHGLKGGPWHDLEKITLERKQKAARVRGARTVRVELIDVLTGPENVKKLVKRGAPYWHPGFVRRQIAGDNVRRPWNQSPEIVTAAQVDGRINHLRLAEVGVSTRRVFGCGTCAVATVTVRLKVDDVAA